MKTKLLTIAMTAALMLTAMTKVQAQDFEGPCLPSAHGLNGHQSAFCGFTQTIELSAGYNWISTYIEVEDPEAMIATLEEGLGENGVSIESMEGMLEYIGMWFGDEFGMTNETMYIVEVSEDCSVELTGAPADPAVHPITIEPEGWNWIGYPVSEEMEVNDALSGFEAEMGDMIESDKDGIVEYVGTWYGDFDTMVPGQGYQYYSASGEVRTLIFHTGVSKAKAKVAVSKAKLQSVTSPETGLDIK